MQGPTHVLAGVATEELFRSIRLRPLRWLLIAVIAFLSHGILDRIARLTYHPADPQWDSAFWVVYHLLVLGLFIFFIGKFWKVYKFGIIFAILPDLDWVILHGSSIFGIMLPFYPSPMIHGFVYWILDGLPLLNRLQHIPSNTHEPSGVLLELVLMVGFLIFIFLVPRLRKFRFSPA